jgi:hypothetical protein
MATPQQKKAVSAKVEEIEERDVLDVYRRRERSQRV